MKNDFTVKTQSRIFFSFAVERAAVLLISFSIFMSSCATDLSTRATRVRLVNIEQVHECETRCEFLGNVKGTAFPGAGLLSWLSVMRRIAYNNALDELLDNAAELGAAYVFVNLGDYHDLRGEAYRCCYCQDPEGNPDTARCMDLDGRPCRPCCVDKSGNVVGASRCKGASAETLFECVSKGGKWIAGIDRKKCEDKACTWIPEAKTREECEAKGKIWVPEARDKASCEAKGGRWLPDEDVLKEIPTRETVGR